MVNGQKNSAGTAKPKIPISGNPWFWIATGFGLGLSPFAPGTVGSLLGVALALLIQPLTGTLFIAVYAATLLLLWLLGVRSAGWLGRYLKTGDPSAVVIDEIMGQFMVTSLVARRWPAVLLSLALSRLFDISKPFPCRRAERLPGGIGVMSDDLVAGIYAIAAYFLIADQFAVFR